MPTTRRPSAMGLMVLRAYAIVSGKCKYPEPTFADNFWSFDHRQAPLLEGTDEVTQAVFVHSHWSAIST